VNARLEVRGLETGYGDVRVLWGVDVDVQPGEVLAIVGPNGAGKTTLMRALSGLLPAAAGAIVLDGQDVTRLAPEVRIARGLIHVPEGRRLFAAMTVHENLVMGAYARRQDVAARLCRVHEYFPILEERADQLAGSLSGGEQQMCAIGRALMADPRILLIDEMSQGLAPIIVERLAEIVAELNRGGLTVVLVEQDAYTALELAHRVMVLAGGRIVLTGTPGTLADSPEFRDAYLLK
jgi:branched-chain amino acid transport system ATP-binding protein